MPRAARGAGAEASRHRRAAFRAWLPADFAGRHVADTPLQHLLFHDAPELVLVMTSANPGDEPMVMPTTRPGRGWPASPMPFSIMIATSCAAATTACCASTTQLHPACRGYTSADPLAQSGPTMLALGGWLKAPYASPAATRPSSPRTSAISTTPRPATSSTKPLPVCWACSKSNPHGRARPASGLLLHAAGGRLSRLSAACRRWPCSIIMHTSPPSRRAWPACPVLGLALDGVGLGPRWGGVGRRTAVGRWRRIPPPGPPRPALARRRSRRARTLAHGGGRAARAGPRCRDRRTLCRPAGRGHHTTDAPTQHQLSAHLQLGRVFDAAAGLLGL